MSVIIGICGGSGAGKTTLARALGERLGHDAAHLAFDSYYRDQSHLTPEQRRRVNYDHPDALDAERLAADLACLHRSEMIELPVYDFATHTRSGDTVLLEPAPYVVVDGILLLSFPPIREALDLTVFVAGPESVRFDRRLRRDVQERGRTPEMVRAQFDATVRPMHDSHVEPRAGDADLVVDGTRPWSDNVEIIVAALDRL